MRLIGINPPRVSQIIIVLVLAVGILSYSTVANAAINSYYGSGYFPVSNLNRCHLGAYATEMQNASARWSADTDLNKLYNCAGTHITTLTANYGNTGWAGFAYICTTDAKCVGDAGFSYNVTYKSCHARLNQWHFDNNPGFYTSAEI